MIGLSTATTRLSRILFGTQGGPPFGTFPSLFTEVPPVTIPGSPDLRQIYVTPHIVVAWPWDGPLLHCSGPLHTKLRSCDADRSGR